MISPEGNKEKDWKLYTLSKNEHNLVNIDGSKNLRQEIFRKQTMSQEWWYTPIIPNSWEDELGLQV
jgi:hypothetical protein